MIRREEVVVQPQAVERDECVELFDHPTLLAVPRYAIREVGLHITGAWHEAVVGTKLRRDSDDVVMEAPIPSRPIEHRFPEWTRYRVVVLLRSDITLLALA